MQTDNSDLPEDAIRRYRLLSNITQDIILFSDRSTLEILDANDAAIKAYGYSREELIGKTIHSLRAPETQPDIPTSMRETDLPQGAAFETLHIRKNGSNFPVEVAARTGAFDDREVIVSTIRDISERRLAAHDVQRLSELWKVATAISDLEATQLHRMLEAAARSISPSMGFTGVLGMIEGDEIVIQAMARDHAYVGLTTAAPVAGSRLLLAGSLAELLREAGTTLSWLNMNAKESLARPPIPGNYSTGIGTPISVSGTTYFLLFLSSDPMSHTFRSEDISFVELIASFFASRLQNTRLRDQLRHQIEHDMLTGLPNRSLLRAAVKRALLEEGTAMIVIIDIDHFGELNESVGHQIADAILVEIAFALQREARDGETLARVGGDNFGLLIRPTFSPTRLERLESLQRLFQQPFSIGDRNQEHVLYVGATIGVAVAPDDGKTFEDLLASADAALNAAKSKERGSIGFFSPEIGHAVVERRTLRRDLAEGLRAGQFEMYYQPTMSIATLTTIGAEALIRWKHPQRGLILPGTFIEFAEEHGMIRKIGRWVMERTVADIASLENIPEAFRCYLNLSMQDFGDLELVERLAALLDLYPRARERIGVEITERATMIDTPQTMKSLSGLRDLGVRIAIDDFGTGHSSLAYLGQFAVDVIKVDQSFIRNVDLTPQNSALVSTMLRIATAFGCKTVAEGVETEGELTWLRENGCETVQGFLFAHPMPLPQFASWLSNQA